MTVRFASNSFSFTALLAAALAGCGDSVATSDTQASTTSSTGTESTTMDVTPTTSTTTDEPTTTSGMTGTSDSTTSTSTSTSTDTSTDTGVSATDATSTSTSTGETSTTDTTTTSTSTGETSTSTSTGETDTSTGDTGELPVACLAADFPVTAALCGDGGPACVTLRKEWVSEQKSFRNDMPAIALRGDCEPVVMYSVAVNGFHGFYAERSGPDTWTAEPTPMTVATGSLATDPDGEATFAMVDDGAFGTSLWRRFDSQWTQESALAGMNHVRAAQLARDSQGRLHVGHVDSNFAVFHEVFDGAWSKEQMITASEIHVRQVLGDDDAAHLTAWSTVDNGWKLHYFAPPAVPEVVAPLGSNVLDRHHTGIALVGATPWVLLARKQADQVHHELVLAHRTGPATWSLQTLVAEDALGDKTCDDAQAQEGATCDYDYTRYFPLALVSSTSEVRALYLALRRKGTMVGQCEPQPFPFCFWSASLDETTSELRVGWPESQPEEHQVAAVDVFTDRADARLDTAGQIHLTFYDDPTGLGLDPAVRYMLIGG